MITQAILGQDATLALGQPSATHPRNHFWRIFVLVFVGDAAVVLLSLALTGWLRFETVLADYGATPPAHPMTWADYGRHVVFGTLLFSLLLAHFRLYSITRMLRLRQVIGLLFKASALWLFAYLAVSALLRLEHDVSRGFMVLGCAATFLGLAGWRVLLHRVVGRAVDAGRLRQRILLVGWSAQAADFIDAITRDRRHLHEVAGCVPFPGGGFSTPPPARIRRLDGGGEPLAGLIRRHRADVVMVAQLDGSHEAMTGIATVCEKELVEFKLIPSCFEVLASGLELDHVNGVPVLGVSRLPLDNPFNQIAKEVLDIVGGAVGLVLFAPVIALFALLVYRESPGPVFYRQRRVGQYGRDFEIIKIRSMRTDAEADGKVGWSRPGDNRRLRIGAFMRKWNIDELPQFWNVLKGDMSLVGPRPERPELIAGFKESIPHYNARHNVKPGITGWAQVNGLRGDTDLGERVRHDLHYIENWGVFMDLAIMLRTFAAHKNAC